MKVKMFGRCSQLVTCKNVQEEVNEVSRYYKILMLFGKHIDIRRTLNVESPVLI